MKKSEIVEKIAAEAGISKKAARVALDVALESIKEAVARGDSVTLVRFGTFQLGSRVVRGSVARNAETGRFTLSKSQSYNKILASGPPTGGGGPGRKKRVYAKIGKI